MLCIHQGDYAVQSDVVLHVIMHHQGVDDGGWIGQASCLYDYLIKLITPPDLQHIVYCMQHIVQRIQHFA